MYEAIGLAEPGKGSDNGSGEMGIRWNQRDRGSREKRGHRVAMHSQGEGDRETERERELSDRCIVAPLNLRFKITGLVGVSSDCWGVFAQSAFRHRACEIGRNLSGRKDPSQHRRMCNGGFICHECQGFIPCGCGSYASAKSSGVLSRDSM